MHGGVGSYYLTINYISQKCMFSVGIRDLKHVMREENKQAR